MALLPVLAATDTPAEDAFVASQGALTARCSTDGSDLVLVRRRQAPLGPALQLTQAALTRGLAVSWFVGLSWYVTHVDAGVVQESQVVGVIPEVVNLAAQQEGPDKLMLISPDARTLAALRDDLPSGLHAQISNPTYLEVTATGVDKASAVAAYCESHGIAAEDVVAIGDGPNDLGLFAFAGRCIAPANARPEVLKESDVVVASNDADGVAQAVLSLL